MDVIYKYEDKKVKTRNCIFKENSYKDQDFFP